MTQKLLCGYRRLVLSAAALLLVACSTTEPAKNSKHIPQNSDRNLLSQLGKSDIDRLADVEIRENTQILRTLMTKLYKRNPRELRKNTTANAEEMVKSIFENQHGWRFKEINEAQGSNAIQQAFRPDYQGDRVMSLIVGLQTMLIKAHGGKTEFYFTDSIEPQNIFNAARNMEIVVWQLSNKRDDKGQLYLFTNELNAHEHNLSFEREFGKIIGSLDMFAITLSEKMQRGITRVVQTLSTAIFLPFGL
ncbi:conserved exported hypothetical protein [Candidatus Nitrotoga sp. BS]|uniref:hypothetical protein n=1 Tax=Candidatus Nitrotoga sp. BS TaxID=2890408 RepID=UPI001EF2C9D1|nr:hypothetical protein [Candidatus Nitrotoga sp. BS]CAH1208488.1 conserved exported hypothetical protein [Candidatus Nitrotoga sp. BS]